MSTQTVNLGKIQPIWRGEYDPSVRYYTLDFLSHNDLMYMVIEPSGQGVVGVEPPEATYYQPFITTLGSASNYDVGTGEDELPRNADLGSASLKDIDFFMQLAGNQTVEGLKMFLTTPKSSDTATESDDLTNKGYVDLTVNQAVIALTAAYEQADSDLADSIQDVIDSLGDVAGLDIVSSPTDVTENKVMVTGSAGVLGSLDLSNHVSVTGVPSDLFGKGFITGYCDGGSAGLGIPAITESSFGVLEVNGQYDSDTSEGYVIRKFTDQTGKVWLQGMVDNSTWGDWSNSGGGGGTGGGSDSLFLELDKDMNTSYTAPENKNIITASFTIAADAELTIPASTTLIVLAGE